MASRGHRPVLACRGHRGDRQRLESALAPGAKAAWTGLFGGPGYLLVATLAGWSVPGWALFLAIAAFVGGFTVLVLRQSDRPPDEDSGPDDGAVV